MSKPIPKLTIREANEHLQRLHDHNHELEERLKAEGSLLEEAEREKEELQQNIRELQRQHEEAMRASAAEVAELKSRAEKAEGQVRRLLDAARERDVAVTRLEEKARLFYEVVEHRPVLRRIVDLLDELGANGSSSSVSSSDRYTAQVNSEPNT